MSTKTVGILGLTALLAGCSREETQTPPLPESNAGKSASSSEKAYVELDPNHFVITADDHGRDRGTARFGENLAKFRAEVSGSFDAVPLFATGPLSWGTLVYRDTVESGDGGKNVIHFKHR